MIFVSIVEDDDDIREGLALLISGTPDFYCSGVYRDCESAWSGVEENPPDVLLLDIELPGISGIQGIPRFRQALPDAEILVLTVHEEEQLIFEALCAGACGYLVKTVAPAKLLAAIREAYQGGAPMSAHIARRVVDSFRKSFTAGVLSGRETEILSLLCQGQSYKMIADLLNISKHTVHTHIKKIYKKLHVNSNGEAVSRALRENLV